MSNNDALDCLEKVLVHNVAYFWGPGIVVGVCFTFRYSDSAGTETSWAYQGQVILVFGWLGCL